MGKELVISMLPPDTLPSSAPVRVARAASHTDDAVLADAAALQVVHDRKHRQRVEARARLRALSVQHEQLGVHRGECATVMELHVRSQARL